MALADQRRDRLAEADTVENLHQSDHIAAHLAPATIPELFFDVDGEAVVAAADRAWADAFNTPSQVQLIPVGYPFDWHRLGAINLVNISRPIPGEGDLLCLFHCAQRSGSVMAWPVGVPLFVQWYSTH